MQSAGRRQFCRGLEESARSYCAGQHNKKNVLALYDLMINLKRSEEATAKFVSPSYIQHNPLIPDGSAALGRFFAKITSERPRARVVVHRIIAVGDYVRAHLNFLNLFNDDPDDAGIAGVDIYRMDAEGKALEHWDTLRLVGTPLNSAPIIAPNQTPTACSDEAEDEYVRTGCRKRFA
jgi:predicted SnoaL-like aldol condensation-catalyzing enzyme